MARQLRPALKSDPELLAEFETTVLNLKSRVSARVVSVAEQVAHPEQPLAFGPDRIARPAGWQFKTGFDHPGRARRLREGGREILQVAGSGAWSTGSWRTLVLLEEGHHELIGRGRTEGVTSVQTNGVILRVSGERSPKGLIVASEWTDLRCQFEVRGIANEELVCEFRGGQDSGWFDPASIRLIREEPTSALDVGPTKSRSPDPRQEVRPR